jgi:hypothetical protein
LKHAGLSGDTCLCKSGKVKGFEGDATEEMADSAYSKLVIQQQYGSIYLEQK